MKEETGPTTEGNTSEERHGDKHRKKLGAPLVPPLRTFHVHEQHVVFGDLRRVRLKRAIKKVKLLVEQDYLAVPVPKLLIYRASEESTSRNEIYLELADGDELALTPSTITEIVGPFLTALADLQHVIDELQGFEPTEVRILSLRMGSVISEISGAANAISSFREDVIPWRREHAQKMAQMEEFQAAALIAQIQAETMAARARSSKDHEDAEKIRQEATHKHLEAEGLRLQNEKLRVEIESARIELALQVIVKINPTLSEEQKIRFVISLLQPLQVLTENPLQITAGVFKVQT